MSGFHGPRTITDREAKLKHSPAGWRMALGTNWHGPRSDYGQKRRESALVCSLLRQTRVRVSVKATFEAVRRLVQREASFVGNFKQRNREQIFDFARLAPFSHP
jgi:hypothetical protein